MKNEPRTIADLQFMIETSSAWFDGCVKYESTNNPVEKGQISDVRYCISTYTDRIEVEKKTGVIAEVRSTSSYSSSIETETIETYNSIEEFKVSEWYELAMDKFSNGDADVSWADAAYVDEEKVSTCDPYKTTDVVMDVGKQYKDWLGNVRQSKGYSTLGIKVDRMSGALCLYCEDYAVEGLTVKDLQEAVDLVQLLKKADVKVDHDAISVPIPSSKQR